MKKLLACFLVSGTVTWSVPALACGPILSKKTTSSIAKSIEHNPNILIPYDSEPDASQAPNKANISTALQKANPALTKHDLARLTYSGQLCPGKTSVIKVMIDHKSTSVVQVRTVMANLQENIVNKISPSVQYSDIAAPTGLTLQDNKNNILASLQRRNSDLTNQERSQLSLLLPSGKTKFIPGVPQQVTVTVTNPFDHVHNHDPQIIIKYTVDTSATLVNKINHISLQKIFVSDVSSASKYTTEDLKNHLQKAGLSQKEVNKIASFSGSLAASPLVKPNITATLSNGFTGTAKFAVTYLTAHDLAMKFSNRNLSLVAKQLRIAPNQGQIIHKLKQNNHFDQTSAGEFYVFGFTFASLQVDTPVTSDLKFIIKGGSSVMTQIKTTVLSAVEVKNQFASLAKQPLKITCEKLKWKNDTEKHQSALTSCFLSSALSHLKIDQSEMNYYIPLFSLVNLKNSGVVTFGTTPPPTSNIKTTITVGTTVTSLPWRMYVETPKSISESTPILGSKTLPILLNRDTSPDITNSRTQEILFTATRRLNQRLDFYVNGRLGQTPRSIIKFAPQVIGKNLNYQQPVAITVTFQVNTLQSVSKTMYAQLG